MFSKTCEYAIKAMVYIWHRDYSVTTWASLKEIAEAIDSPPSFTSKVLQQLAKKELLLSMRGPSGGFSKLKKGDIRLGDVIMAIDGPKITRKCILGFEECNTAYPCALHDKFAHIRDDLNKVLDETKIEGLGDLFSSGAFYLKED
ncbi:Rrf2 family transcriptional regulator [Cryomorphaceae bacterium 1068]|nr:Rrf2 family transcriptional regulator [Cryomorphaceae bacterium 1068]